MGLQLNDVFLLFYMTILTHTLLM